MATVDLTKLSEELTAAGRSPQIHKHSTGTYLTVHPIWLVYSDGEFQFYGGKADESWWRELDIIRRHLASVAPPAALRERGARVAFDAFYAEGTAYTEIEQAMFLQVTDAILAVIAPPVDTEAVMAAVETLWENGGCSCPGCREQSAAHLAHIRAMLEGRAG